MRPIKFRGRDKRGNVFYGSYNQDMGCIDDWEYAGCHTVDPDTVAQLVGYDANGKEVYDDDKLIDQDGLEYTISDVVQVELFCGGVYEPLYSNRYKFTLKEADHDTN